MISKEGLQSLPGEKKSNFSTTIKKGKIYISSCGTYQSQ